MAALGDAHRDTFLADGHARDPYVNENHRVAGMCGVLQEFQLVAGRIGEHGFECEALAAFDEFPADTIGDGSGAIRISFQVPAKQVSINKTQTGRPDVCVMKR